MKKGIRYTLWTVILLALLLTGGGYYMLGYSLRPEGLARSRDVQGSLEYMFTTYPHLVEWVDSLQQAGALGELYMESHEGVNLHALYIAGAVPTRRTAVIVHGYTDNAIRMLMVAYIYNKMMGFNVLLPDLYAHGQSGGDAIRMGWKDRIDVLQWMERADELFGRHNEEVGEGDSTTYRSTGTQMVVHGISMGAATTMMVAGEVEHGLWQMPYVKCFVEDCGYTSVWDEFASELKARFSLPAFPLMHVTNLLCRLEYGWSFSEASALKQLKKSTRPMLFIHGDKDDFVPTRMVYPLYDTKAGDKELWVVPGVGHAHACKDYPEEYAQRVRAFVEKYMD
ncbi:MAG: alpha/beta hydrolase [Bacteroides sp.]|nr:alpha/beta hydrolase [Bacteroides sp.]